MVWIKALFGSKNSPRVSEAEPPLQAGQATLSWEDIVVPGAKALETVLALRGTQSAGTPVALGDDDDLQRVLETLECNDSSTEEIIRAGEALDVDGWLKDRIAAAPDYYQEDEPGSSADSEPVQAPSLSLAFDVLSGKPKVKMHVALVPTAKPWEVPAYLKIGNWNECPAAEVHVAFFKSWFERYGACVTGIGPDTVEFSVANPPRTMEDARRLAHEQFVYCADIVHQGVQSVENLAKVLQNSGNWYFWWD